MQSFQIKLLVISIWQLVAFCKLPAANRQSLNHKILTERIFFRPRINLEPNFVFL